MIEFNYSKGKLELKSDVCFANNEQVNNLIKVLEAVIGADVDKTILSAEPIKWVDEVRSPSSDIKESEELSRPGVRPMPEEKIIVRDRLPNIPKGKISKDNIIDMSTLKVETPAIQQAKRFRCPDCMQSVVIKVNGLTIMRDMDKEDHLVIIEGYEFINNEYFDYSKALNMVSELDVSLVTNGDFVGHCPICRGGNDVPDRNISIWVDTFDHPENHCDYENPCPMCGGESLMVITQDKDSNNLECEVCKYKFKEGI